MKEFESTIKILLYTESQAMEVTQLSRSTLRRLESLGSLRSVRIGRAVRYLASEIERFVESLAAGQADGLDQTSDAR